MLKIIEITDNLDCNEAYNQLSHPESGGMCVFIGSVRQSTQDKEVTSLFFEAYTEMAISQMHEIANEAAEKWNLNSVIMKHAVGKKDVQEPVVLVGASSAHRDACFEACRFLIDTLKKNVPIWKKEFFANSDEVWVTQHP
ncbi:molybdopterin synthase subunit MoaE [Flavobacteriaceae bacterium MAR_2010_188]|nr:molybdopterin synthase subunit MoaE [Flavobacteriaceae bacterium MAR_2010_188]